MTESHRRSRRRMLPAAAVLRDASVAMFHVIEDRDHPVNGCGRIASCGSSRLKLAIVRSATNCAAHMEQTAPHRHISSAMTTDMLLARANKCIDRGHACIVRQLGILQELETDGHPTQLARELLNAMMVSLAHMIDDRDKIECLRSIETAEWVLSSDQLRRTSNDPPPR